MTIQEVADQLVGFCREGKFREAIEALYSPDIVSMEAGAPSGGSRVTRGIEAVRSKNDRWNANHEPHSTVVEGPLVTGSHFVVTMKMDLTSKPDGRRFTMEEVAVYEVADGKIVYEEFFYRL